MNYLLDSNIIEYFTDEHSIFYENVANKILNLGQNDELYVSILTIFEFEYSFSASDVPERREKLRKTIDWIKNEFIIIGIDADVAKSFGEIKAKHRIKHNISSKNMKKHNFDIMIASSAILNSLKLVSADKIFQSIPEISPELQTED
ncbi:MAG: type II toxin-antitoxin system VapC family toxin, partial [Nitrospinae bacterium]|nr:type II toxin-antitoxin system VapC family toxin [Nitrospinota bacterium]